MFDVRRLFASLHWRLAFVGVPAVPAILLLGQRLGDPMQVAIAAGAAFSVGFGTARELGGHRWGAMAAAMVGMAAAGFLGTLAGSSFQLLDAMSAVLGMICALLALRDEDWWWVMLQVVIAFMIAGAFPGPIGDALSRAEAILLGGILQILAVVVLANLLPGRVARLPRGQAQALPGRSIVVAHCLRVALSVGASLLIARSVGLVNDYWAAITALVILKPGLHETSWRGWLRSAGTIGGCAIATGVALLLHDSFVILVAGATLAIGSAYALQRANYAVFTAAVTSSVVFLVTIGQAGVLLNAEHRLYATVIGCMVAISLAALLPHRPKAAKPSVDHLGEVER